jgi:hypothetical protein
MITERGKEDTRMNWYMNPELHEEDYTELVDLLEEEDPE